MVADGALGKRKISTMLQDLEFNVFLLGLLRD